ncbi:uncharacterized protein LOC26526118 [Drosophila erecta]|uniref:Gustatory receptor n=1 Tax=Drosophila erecta TaxID=7220 RepID=A0A0Q5U1Y8_DROER|nr:uncharacterized protein LOC26526118 [Drosophila erecta]KQS43135.1 uncharacterized protein Dere_GG26294 [Drosophila erecta]
MARLRFILNIAKVLRFPSHFFGLLQLRFNTSQQTYQQRPNFCRFLPAVFITLILLLHKLSSYGLERENKLVNVLQIEKRPLRSELELWSENLTSIYIFLTLVCSLVNKNELWKLINEAQTNYKKLKSLLGKHLVLECSWVVLIYVILLLLLLAMMLVNIVFLNWPKTSGEPNTVTVAELHQLSDYIMGIPRLFFVLIMALRILFHLINAGWLQCLRMLRLQRNLKLYQFQLRNIFSNQKGVNILAGHYFKVSYMCFLCMIAFRIAEFLQFFKYNADELVQKQKSQDDLDDEAFWEGQEDSRQPNLKEPLMTPLLILSWHFALWMLLLAAAYTQQKEYCNLMEKSWNFKSDEHDCEMKEFLDENCWTGHAFKQLDILDLLFFSGIPICDHQPVSICFITNKLRNSNSVYFSLNTIARHFKLLLNLVVAAGIVYIVQQVELRHLQQYLEQV